MLLGFSHQILIPPSKHHSRNQDSLSQATFSMVCANCSLRFLILADLVSAGAHLLQASTCCPYRHVPCVCTQLCGDTVRPRRIGYIDADLTALHVLKNVGDTETGVLAWSDRNVGYTDSESWFISFTYSKNDLAFGNSINWISVNSN